MLKMSKGITPFTITVDVWLLYSQALSSLKIYEQVLNNQPLSEYAFSLFVLITSTAFSLLEFYRDNCSRRKYSTQRFSLKSLMSVLCAIFLFGGAFFLSLLVFGVPSFQHLFPIAYVKAVLIIIPVRQVLQLVLHVHEMLSQN